MLKVQRLQQNENEIKSINNLTTTGFSWIWLSIVENENLKKNLNHKSCLYKIIIKTSAYHNSKLNWSTLHVLFTCCLYNFLNNLNVYQQFSYQTSYWSNTVVWKYLDLSKFLDLLLSQKTIHVTIR
jgi:hypothetical protein